MAESPSAHVWLDVPATCRFEGELITHDELYLVFGDRRVDGHTLVFDRSALARFRDLATDLLNTAMPDDPKAECTLVSVA